MDYQNETLRTLFEKHSICKYLDKLKTLFVTRDRHPTPRPRKKGRVIRIVEAKP